MPFSDVNVCMRDKTTLYKSKMNSISLTDPFMLVHAEREREREGERERDDDHDESRSK